MSLVRVHLYKFSSLNEGELLAQLDPWNLAAEQMQVLKDVIPDSGTGASVVIERAGSGENPFMAPEAPMGQAKPYHWNVRLFSDYGQVFFVVPFGLKQVTQAFSYNGMLYFESEGGQKKQPFVIQFKNSYDEFIPPVADEDQKQVQTPRERIEKDLKWIVQKDCEKLDLLEQIQLKQLSFGPLSITRHPVHGHLKIEGHSLIYTLDSSVANGKTETAYYHLENESEVVTGKIEILYARPEPVLVHQDLEWNVKKGVRETLDLTAYLNIAALDVTSLQVLKSPLEGDLESDGAGSFTFLSSTIDKEDSLTYRLESSDKIYTGVITLKPEDAVLPPPPPPLSSPPPKWPWALLALVFLVSTGYFTAYHYPGFLLDEEPVAAQIAPVVAAPSPPPPPSPVEITKGDIVWRVEKPSETLKLQERIGFAGNDCQKVEITQTARFGEVDVEPGNNLVYKRGAATPRVGSDALLYKVRCGDKIVTGKISVDLVAPPRQKVTKNIDWTIREKREKLDLAEKLGLGNADCDPAEIAVAPLLGSLAVGSNNVLTYQKGRNTPPGGKDFSGYSIKCNGKIVSGQIRISLVTPPPPESPCKQISLPLGAPLTISVNSIDNSLQNSEWRWKKYPNTATVSGDVIGSGSHLLMTLNVSGRVEVPYIIERHDGTEERKGSFCISSRE